MQDKKIISPNDVKENNPNDDEEILKNIHSDLPAHSENNDGDRSGNNQEKRDDPETLKIP